MTGGRFAECFAPHTTVAIASQTLVRWDTNLLQMAEGQ